MKLLNLITLAVPLALFSACAVTPRVAVAERATTSYASPCVQANNMKLTKEREGFEDPDNAIRLLSACLSGWPDAPTEYRALSLQMRAVAHAQKKDYTHAIADREESLRLMPPRTGWDFISLASDYRENGQPERDYGIQGIILEITNNSEVPSLIHYLPTPVFRESSPRMGYVPVDPKAKVCLTAECAAGMSPNMTVLAHKEQATRAADFAAGISAWSGRVAAASTVAGNPVASAGATSLGLAASLFEQLVRPTPSKSANDAFVDFTATAASNRYPYLAPVFTEIGELVKGMNFGVPFK